MGNYQNHKNNGHIFTFQGRTQCRIIPFNNIRQRDDQSITVDHKRSLSLKRKHVIRKSPNTYIYTYIYLYICIYSHEIVSKSSNLYTSNEDNKFNIAWHLDTINKIHLLSSIECVYGRTLSRFKEVSSSLEMSLCLMTCGIPV